MTPRGDRDAGAWLIRRIIRAYPRQVRAPVGEQLHQATVSNWRAARDDGPLNALRWWWTEGRALVVGAVVERFERTFRRGSLGWNTPGDRRGPPWEGVVVDIKWLLRGMSRNLGFSVSFTAVLALALGLSSAVFAFTDGVLLKPLRYAKSDRLVAVWAARPGEGLDRVPLTQWDIQQVIARSDVFESVGGFTQQRTAMQLSVGVIEIGFGWLTGGIHDVLDVQPVLGRTFTKEERGELVALLDHGFWQRQFGGDPDILGKTIRIAQQSWTVVGVLPPNTPLELPSRGRVPQPTDVWSTMWVDGADPDANSAWIRTVARLAPSISIEQARAALADIADAARIDFPERNEAGFALTADLLKHDMTSGISRTLWMLFAGSMILLLAAMTNAGHLIVLHHERRRRRTAIRLAIGASSSRLAATAWIEAIMLSTIAGLLALPLGRVLLSALVSWSPTDVPRLDVVRFDTRAMVFLLIASIVAVVLVGALSMYRTRQVPVDAVLRRERRESGHWAGGRLVSLQVAFAVPLMIVGTLLARSALALSDIDPGFMTDGATTLRLALPNHEINRTELTGILEDFHNRVRALPGVETVGSANLIPLGGGAFTGPVGTTLPDLDEPRAVESDYRYITPGYLESLRVPLLEGAWPRSGDPDLAVVVDEALSQRLWPEGNVLGQALSAQPLGDRRDDFIVIGVVGTTRHETLREAGRPTVYFTSPRYTLPYMTTIVRGQVSAASLFSRARQFGYEAHPDFLVAEARDLDEIVSSANALTRWLVTMVSVLALGASIISAVGLYAVVGQFVTAYRPYLGIRRALGARPLHVVVLVARRVSLIVVTGCVLGIMLASVAATFLRSELVGVEPSDPVTWATAFFLLVVLSAAAIAFPVRGAIAVSPLDVLRSE